MKNKLVLHIFRKIKDNYKIVEAIYENGNTYLEEVIGEVNLKTILPLFVKTIVNN